MDTQITLLIKKKKDIYRNYKKLIGKSKDFILNESEKHTLTTNWISYLNFSNKFKFKKEKLIKEVQKYKILLSTSVHIMLLHAIDTKNIQLRIEIEIVTNHSLYREPR